MRHVPILACLILAACSGGSESPTAGGVTPDEARALDDAAEMLEDQRLPADAAAPGQAAPARPAAPATGGASPEPTG